MESVEEKNIIYDHYPRSETVLKYICLSNFFLEKPEESEIYEWKLLARLGEREPRRERRNENVLTLAETQPIRCWTLFNRKETCRSLRIVFSSFSLISFVNGCGRKEKFSVGVFNKVMRKSEVEWTNSFSDYSQFVIGLKLHRTWTKFYGLKFVIDKKLQPAS